MATFCAQHDRNFIRGGLNSSGHACADLGFKGAAVDRGERGDGCARLFYALNLLTRNNGGEVSAGEKKGNPCPQHR